MAGLAVSQRHSSSLGGVAGGGAKPRRKECLTARKGGVTGLSATLMALYMGYGATGPAVCLFTRHQNFLPWSDGSIF